MSLRNPHTTRYSVHDFQLEWKETFYFMNDLTRVRPFVQTFKLSETVYSCILALSKQAHTFLCYFTLVTFFIPRVF